MKASEIWKNFHWVLIYAAMLWIIQQSLDNDVQISICRNYYASKIWQSWKVSNNDTWLSWLHLPHYFAKHSYDYMGAWTKWRTLCRRHFKITFLVKTYCVLMGLSLTFVLKGRIVNTWSLIQEMAWREYSRIVWLHWASLGHSGIMIIYMLMYIIIG